MTTRIYQDSKFTAGDSLRLEERASHHLINVLRAKVGNEIILFNGKGKEYSARITQLLKRNVDVFIESSLDRETESPLKLILVQGISRGEKMDFTIQKAVELGVHKIIPLITERCNVKLDKEKKQKRLEHWQAIIISACEQCGRSILPEITMPQPFARWVGSLTNEVGFILAPNATIKLNQYKSRHFSQLSLLIGPEGGLSDQEIQQVLQKGFLPLNLGPRILRTETAGIAALGLLQGLFGDLG